MDKDNDKRNKVYSSYVTFSRVCHSDPNNPGKMICKEVDSTNGEKHSKEFTYDIKNGNSEYNNLGSDNHHNSVFSQISNMFNNRAHTKSEHINHPSIIIPRNFEELFGFNDPFFNDFSFFDDSLDDLMGLNDLLFNRYQLYNPNTMNQEMNYKERKRPETYHNYKVYDV